MAKPDLKARCIKLRREQRLSHKEIRKMTGASMGSLSLWLRDFPLTKKEKLAKHDPQKCSRQFEQRSDLSKYFLLVGGQDLSRARKGRIAEAAVLFRLALHGLVPFRAAFDGESVDWVVDVDGYFKKIQVKWAAVRKSGKPSISLMRTEGHNVQRRYSSTEVDFIVGYDLRSDTCYVWSMEELRSEKYRMVISQDAAERWDKLMQAPLKCESTNHIDTQ